jgi:hypothetical protein
MFEGLRKGGFRLMAFAAVAVCGWNLLAEEPKSDDAFTRQFWADARVYSLRPGEELATYHGRPGGGVGPNGTLGLGFNDRQRQFKVTIVAKAKSQRFLTKVTVTPDEEDTRTQAQEIEYDLSDLNPRTLEIAREDDGLVYRLSLIPRIIENPKPKQFKASDLRLEYWSFPSSPVILNDQDYIGRLAMSSGPIASCDIPGLAKVEFSLLHLKDATPSGALEDGVINIAHDGTTLRISDVKNGRNAEVLSGGPYRVWVRWTKPSLSVEEYFESLKEHIASLKERVKSGDLTLPLGTLERLEKISQSGRIGSIGNGLRGVEEGDLVEPGE